jgi:type III restriction enzyme
MKNPPITGAMTGKHAFSLSKTGGARQDIVATEHSKAFDDPGKFIEIPLVNKIRARVKAWSAEYSGVTGITKRLLEHWRNPEEREHRRFFFCQLEAIETLIWLKEAPESEKVGCRF